MTGLSEKRRWINISKLDQSFYNPKQASYEVVVPGSFIEGKHMADVVKNCPWFRETTAHLTQKEIIPLIQEETDLELLKVTAIVEQYTGRRDAVLKIIDARIKTLSKSEVNDGNTSNTAHN